MARPIEGAATGVVALHADVHGREHVRPISEHASPVWMLSVSNTSWTPEGVTQEAGASALSVGSVIPTDLTQCVGSGCGELPRAQHGPEEKTTDEGMPPGQTWPGVQVLDPHRRREAMHG